MSSSIHFRFKSAKEFETLSFEGDFLKVADLKVAIVERKKLNFGEGFDLEISDASTSDVFHDENSLVQKNTSVIVRRIPGLKQGGILSQQEMAAKNERYAEKNVSRGFNVSKSDGNAAEAQDNAIPKTIEGEDEAARIESLVMQSAAYDQYPQQPRGRYNRGGHRSRAYGNHGHRKPHPDRAPRPSHNYVCHRCNKPGHWIDECPTNGDPKFDKIKVRAPTGIPRSMLRQVDAPESGTGLQDSSGHFVTLQPNEEEFARQTFGLRLSQAAAAASGKPAEDGSNDGSRSSGDKPSVSPNGTPEEHPGTDQNDGPIKDKGSDQIKVGGKDQKNDDSSSFTKASDSSREQNPKNSTSTEKNDDKSNNKTKNTPNGIGRPNGKHDGRYPSNKNQNRRGPNVGRPPTGMGMPGIPLPNMPPGFPPMPPFPPPPPQVLMAMAAMANNQNGVAGMPPALIPGMPFPFPNMPSGNASEGSGDGKGMNGFGFPPTMLPPPAGGNQKGSGNESRIAPETQEVGLDRKTREATKSPDGVPSMRMKAKGGRDASEKGHSDRGGKLSPAAPSGSRSEKTSSRDDQLPPDSAEKEHRRHDKTYENEPAPPRDSRAMRPLHRAPDASPSPIPHPKSDMDTAQRPRSSRRSTPDSNRDKSKSPRAKDDSRYRMRHVSPDRRDRSRTGRYRSPRARSNDRERLRRRSPSPITRDRRSTRSRVSPERGSRKSRSPTGRSRYDGDLYRSGRRRDRHLMPRHSRRVEDRVESSRRRCRSPLPPRYGSRRGSPEPSRTRPVSSRRPYSPPADGGRRDPMDRVESRRRAASDYDGYRGGERDAKRKRISRGDDYSRKVDELKARKDDASFDRRESRRSQDRDRAEARERSPGLRRRDERLKRGRELANGDERDDPKRLRRDSSLDHVLPRREERREERRDRVSVHDRLGRPLGDRKRSRRSVHDRLG
ncbi:unnamed protein product [Agarophyton chilense]|eukprot:gb/GEZJ01001127.1/.p1 GENE.gb/GEZJ01001127.1/~~gb/GEZJ01001127.1/.p1  ORF type:complete len:945 (-),score=134.33 gb/GEZJ01001127.1/:1121-3955(-)